MTQKQMSRALAPALLGLPAFCGLGGIAARVPLAQATFHVLSPLSSRVLWRLAVPLLRPR